VPLRFIATGDQLVSNAPIASAPKTPAQREPGSEGVRLLGVDIFCVRCLVQSAQPAEIYAIDLTGQEIAGTR
jgi:hypothetical protein